MAVTLIPSCKCASFLCFSLIVNEKHPANVVAYLFKEEHAEALVNAFNSRSTNTQGLDTRAFSYSKDGDLFWEQHTTGALLAILHDSQLIGFMPTDCAYAGHLIADLADLEELMDLHGQLRARS